MPGLGARLMLVSHFYLFVSLTETLMIQSYQWYYYWVALCPGWWQRPDLKTILATTDTYAQSDPRIRDMNTYFPTKTHYLMAAVDSLDAFSVPKGKIL